MSEMIIAGRYEVIEKIGTGGMAVVYKGRDRLLNRYIAIKILKPEFLKDPAIVESFRNESQAAARLAHPNIVNVYDVGKEGNVHYIVMELIVGPTLSEVIKSEGPLDYKRAINIGIQMASALSLAHKNNIIHRDVKPHNILISSDGTAKITDFGIAKAVTDATIVGKSNQVVMGSVHYFSPEQARGGYVDEKSDIYSLGVVMYEMLTGRVPFDADNPVTVAVMHMNDKPMPPSSIVSGIPPGLEQIVLKALEKYQINRFLTVDDMLAALENVNFVTGIIDNKAVADLLKQNSAVNENKERDYRQRDQGGDNEYDDDYDDDDRDVEYMPKKKKVKKGNRKSKIKLTRTQIIAIVLALVCAIPISFLVYSGISGLGGDKTVEVPDLVGMTEKEAEESLEELKLKLEVVDVVFDDKYKSGEIVSQETNAKTMVKEGYLIKVNISKGEGDEDDQEVPNMVGMKLKNALKIVEENNYEKGSVSYEDNEQPKDYVIKHTPEAGEEAINGMKINFVVSSGPKEEEDKEKMPNIVGLSDGAAKTAIEKAGLKVGAVEKEPNSVYQEGFVIWQQYKEGEELSQGASVNYKVSAGVTSNEPRTVPINISFDKAPSDVFNLTVMLVDENGQTKTIINEAIRDKSDGNEVITVSGKGKGTVYVNFSGTQMFVFNVDFTNGTAN